MQKFISCDWGTSALRLRLVDVSNMTVLAEIAGPQGISATFALWKQSGRQERERVSFYQSVLNKQVTKLEEQSNFSLQDVPLIMSGMSSSNMGMIELSYKDVPFNTDGHDLFIKPVEATDNFKHKALMVSGVTTGNDVMRGEETQLIGCVNTNDKGDQFFIFPGTHSKHVRVRNGEVVDFKTYMTGEFFDLLSKKSILSNSVKENNSLDGTNLKSFENGITDSSHINILHSSFLVRTNYLFEKLSKEENYHYISGLLIGTELKELITISTPVVVVSDGLLLKLYSAALERIGVDEVRHLDAGIAIVRGHCKIYGLYKSKLNS